MKTIIANLLLVLILFGCGGSGSSSSDDKPTALTETPQTSNVLFYLPNWFSQQGMIEIYDDNNTLVDSVETTLLSNTSVSLSPGRNYTVKFVPLLNKATCPNQQGCGNYASANVDDLNQNGIIDQNEQFPVFLEYVATIKPAPGKNTVYFSPQAMLENIKQVNSHFVSRTATSFYLQTPMDQADASTYQLVSDALNYAYLSLAQQNDFNQTLVQTGESSFASITDSYQALIDNAMNYLQNSILLIDGDVDQNTDFIAATAMLSAYKSINEQSVMLQTQINADELSVVGRFRDVINLMQLQQDKYSEDLNQRVQNVNSLFDANTEQLFNTLGTVLTDIIGDYSPTQNNPTGTYQIGQLTLIYSSSPYRWQISGLYNNQNVAIDLQLPSWRISASRGDLAEGILTAQIDSQGQRLVVNSEEIKIQFDGVENVFVDKKAETAIATINTNITVEKEATSLAAKINLRVNRILDSNNVLTNALVYFQLYGDISTIDQVNKINITAADASPYDQKQNFIYYFALEFPLNGAEDFSFSAKQISDNNLAIFGANTVFTLKNQLIEMNLTGNNSTFNLLLKGELGYQLVLNKNGKNYTGALRYGEQQLAEVKMLKSVPGLLFADGRFESLL
jgi:hypothetical protein